MEVQQKEQMHNGSERHQPPEQDNSFTTVLNQLMPEERCVCEWRRLGFSSRQIARYQGNSVAAVNALYSQAMAKIRRLLNVKGSFSPWLGTTATHSQCFQNVQNLLAGARQRVTDYKRYARVAGICRTGIRTGRLPSVLLVTPWSEQLDR